MPNATCISGAARARYRDAHRFPLVSPDARKVQHSYRVAPSVAWKYPRLELRVGESWPALSFDCDGPEAVDKLMAAVVVGADLSSRTSSRNGRRAGTVTATSCWRLRFTATKARMAPLRLRGPVPVWWTVNR